MAKGNLKSSSLARTPKAGVGKRLGMKLMSDLVPIIASQLADKVLRPSKTSTKTQSRERTIVSSGHGIITNSKVSIKYKKQKFDKLLHTIYPSSTVQTNTSGQLSSDVATQANVNTVYAFEGGGASGSNPTTANLKTLDLYKFANMNNAFTDPLNVNSAEKKLLLTSYDSEMLITSASSVISFVEIYDLVAKQTGVFEIPTDLWNQGIINSRDVFTQNDFNVYNARPTQSKAFNLKWKVLKRTSVQLVGGATHRHKFNISLRRLIDTDHFYNNGMVRGITCAQMIVVKGGQVVTNAANSITTLPLAKVLWEINCRYKGSGITFTPRKYLRFNTLSTAPIIPTIIDPDLDEQVAVVL